MDQVIAFEGEVQLLSWTESHRNGATVTFQLSDAEDLDSFKSMTTRSGKRSGQRLAIVAVQIGDDEQPVRQPPKTTVAQRAVALCKQPLFWKWANENVFGVHVESEEDAKSYICSECGVTSRSLIEDSPSALRVFEDIEELYREWKATKEHARV